MESKETNICNKEAKRLVYIFLGRMEFRIQRLYPHIEYGYGGVYYLDRINTFSIAAFAMGHDGSIDLSIMFVEYVQNFIGIDIVNLKLHIKEWIVEKYVEQTK